MIFTFPEPRTINGRIVIGELRKWVSVDNDDDLFILECKPIYWEDVNTPVKKIQPTNKAPQKPPRRRLTEKFRQICLDKNLAPFNFK